VHLESGGGDGARRDGQSIEIAVRMSSATLAKRADDRAASRCTAIAARMLTVPLTERIVDRRAVGERYLNRSGGGTAYT
jgi:hypothetical protein